MKKLLLLITSIVLSQIISAQYCGNSGPAQCNISGTMTQPGLTPMYDTLPPFENNVASTTVIQFRNFNVVYFQGTAFTLQSLKIDTIDNLPGGLCWASDRANNTYANSENGCIKVNGIPCDSTGQYKLRIIATVTTSSPVVITLQVDAATAGDLHYYVRLINTGDTITPVDSAGSPRFIAYGDTCSIPLPPVVSLGADQNVCTGSNITLNPVITNGQPPFTYSWQATGNGLSCANCPNPTVTLSQNSFYFLTVTDAYNRVTNDTIAYTVTGAGGNFQIAANGATTFCSGNTLTLDAAANPAFAIQWQRNGVDIPTAMDTAYVVTDSSGVYSAVFTGGGCTATSNNITVTVNETPSVSVTPAGTVSICQGENVMLQSTATAGVTYLWQLNGSNLNAATNPSYTASFGGTYRVIVKTAADCSDTSNAVVIAINPLPAVSLVGNPDSVCTTSGPVTLTGGTPAGGTYNGPAVTGNTFTPATAGTGSHTVAYSYTDANNCTNVATHVIVVRLCTGINELNGSETLTLFPNPVNDILSLESRLFSRNDVTVALVDVRGEKMICDCKVEGDKVSINTASLSSGVYFIKVQGPGLELSRKFVKFD